MKIGSQTDTTVLNQVILPGAEGGLVNLNVAIVFRSSNNLNDTKRGFVGAEIFYS